MTEQSRIDIALLLPDVPDARDACVQRLADLLKSKDGIETAHVPDAAGEDSDQLCREIKGVKTTPDPFDFF